MKDIYHLLTVNDVHKDEKAIVDVLKGIFTGELKNDLRILNYYKEIPVSYDATISHIDDDLVEMQVHQHQAVVMFVEKIAFLKSNHFPHDVLAKVYKANINKCIGLLHNFSYTQIRAERRRFVRVQIVDPVKVNFRRIDKNFDGHLIDISIGGLSLATSEQIDIAVDTAGILTVEIPNGKLEMPGRLLKIIPGESSSIYIFEIEASSRIEAAVSQFIFQKQVEIIRELKDQLVYG
ncbi:pilZ domain protein [Geobacter sp. OR-1]|uniref:PilZ domain-containing protein n=1 Tax=Geobacter sp. OR-1 TaxID=1266765 RepID=UPI0005429EAA|nr:PilZ domain-containing protein [Geobacter sp. OR-1]GAM09264.1 pilZ domain protein [Geobacter sp. OR-1]